MSAAITLASIDHGFSFAYIGGTVRDKDGIGQVVTGHEQIHSSINPWDFLAVNEKKQIGLLFNQFQFKAAKELADALINRTTKNKSLFKLLSHMIDGYYKWDLFRHNEAFDLFKRARLTELTEFDDKSLQSFAHTTQDLMPFLENVVNNKKSPSILLVLDMYSNAERRFKEGKLDDAILRLYRLVEMIAQQQLFIQYSIDSSDVSPASIPKPLRAKFERDYRKHYQGKIKIPQAAAFELLEALNNDIGKAFKNNEKQFREVQSSRNNSYLAHGFISSKDKTYLHLRDFVLSLNLLRAEDSPVFPLMEI